VAGILGAPAAVWGHQLEETNIIAPYLASCRALDSVHCCGVLLRIHSKHRPDFARRHDLAVRTCGPGELRPAPHHPAKGRPFSRIRDFRLFLVSCFFSNLSERHAIHLGWLGHRVYFLNCVARRVASKLFACTDWQVRGCGARYLWGPSARVHGPGCNPATSLSRDASARFPGLPSVSIDPHPSAALGQQQRSVAYESPSTFCDSRARLHAIRKRLASIRYSAKTSPPISRGSRRLTRTG
jgi:hypothetical protein